jgi:hypothetical protein
MLQANNRKKYEQTSKKHKHKHFMNYRTQPQLNDIKDSHEQPMKPKKQTSNNQRNQRNKHQIKQQFRD